MSHLPTFDALPKVRSPSGHEMPHGCTWGLWDKDGQKDVLGTLNLLTPPVVQAAYAEARDGLSISLNLPLNALISPGGFRKTIQHIVLPHQATLGAHGFDDELIFNTQCSSQWDSLVHWHHQPSACAYNGAQPAATDLQQDALGYVDSPPRFPTLQHWHPRGGLVARGVLLDYGRWADRQGKKVDLFRASPITLAELQACAIDQGVEFRAGDVLIVRSGFVEELVKLDAEGQTAAFGTGDHGLCGVEGMEEVARWVWDNHFSAVAGDMIAWERIPPMAEGGFLKLGMLISISPASSFFPMEIFTLPSCPHQIRPE